MATYLSHHLEIAGGKAELFSDDAVMAIYQIEPPRVCERL
jgi:hypothetical protein